MDTNSEKDTVLMNEVDLLEIKLWEVGFPTKKHLGQQIEKHWMLDWRNVDAKE